MVIQRNRSTPGAPHPHRDWEEFKENLSSVFGDSDPTAMAKHKMTVIKQGTRTAEEYCIEFRDLSFRTGYNDNAHIEFFKKGLHQEILKQIYRLLDLPTSLDDWYKFAIRFD